MATNSCLAASGFTQPAVAEPSCLNQRQKLPGRAGFCFARKSVTRMERPKVHERALQLLRESVDMTGRLSSRMCESRISHRTNWQLLPSPRLVPRAQYVGVV